MTGGFVWIHWLAANITRTEIRENESQTATDFIQGRNSWTSIQGGGQSAELSSYYGGMTPPDGPHMYELHVYALDQMLDLEKGFLLNELYRKMETDYFMAAASGQYFSCKAGKRYRGDYPENASGAAEGTAGIWFCGKENL